MSTVAVSGDRKMTTTGENTAQIVDLQRREDLRPRPAPQDLQGDDVRRDSPADARGRGESSREPPPRQPKEEQPAKNEGKEMEIDFDVKNTGQTKTINGFDTRQVIATITVREKGKKIEESGGIVMTVDTWLTKAVVAERDRRFRAPLLREARRTGLRRRRAADGDGHGDVSGTEGSVRAPQPRRLRRNRHSDDDHDRCGQERGTDEAGGSRRFVGVERRQAESTRRSAARSAASCAGASSNKEKEAAAKPNANPARSTFMTINNEVLKIASNVTAAEVAMPAGFKERN